MQPLSLGKYYHEMGTGSIDAWMLMIQIEGIPSILARTGENQWLSIDDYFGTASKSLTYIGVEVPESTRTSLDLNRSRISNMENCGFTLLNAAPAKSESRPWAEEAISEEATILPEVWKSARKFPL